MNDQTEQKIEASSSPAQPRPSQEGRECCGQPMVENWNGTGIRCAKKCGYWEARPPYIKVEIVNGDGIQRGHRAVVFDDTRITPVKISPCTVEESWAVNVNHLLDNPAFAFALDRAKQEGREAALDEAIGVVGRTFGKKWTKEEMAKLSEMDQQSARMSNVLYDEVLASLNALKGKGLNGMIGT